MSDNIIYIEKNYDDYYFMDYLYDLLNKNGVWDYLNNNYSDEEKSLINDLNLNDVDFMQCGRDDAYEFGYDLFDVDDEDDKAIIQKNDIDSKSDYIANKNDLFSCFFYALIQYAKKVKELEEKYHEICVGHDPEDYGSLLDLLFDFLFEDGWKNHIKDYLKIPEEEKEYFDEYMGDELDDVPGINIISYEGGGAWETVYYDMYLKKEKMKEAKVYLIGKVKSNISEFLSRCHQCGDILGVSQVIHDDYKDLIFCKMPCANKYFWKNAKKRCPQCDRGLSIRVKTNENYPGLYFCKDKCALDYKN